MKGKAVLTNRRIVLVAVLGTSRVPNGHWFLFRQCAKDEHQAGCSVLLYHDEMGYAGRAGGPVVVE